MGCMVSEGGGSILERRMAQNSGRNVPLDITLREIEIEIERDSR